LFPSTTNILVPPDEPVLAPVKLNTLAGVDKPVLAADQAAPSFTDLKTPDEVPT
jgi:hypothetical protein